MTELEFADRLRKYRKAKQMTQQELAERLGVSDKSVSRWENGSYPDVAMLGPLARELGVTVDDLLGTVPPLQKLERSDLQNWLSYAFAIGGGILFFLLELFLPILLCYAAYLGLMAYGVYLQKNYTFHSKWFHIGNLVMNFFINLEIAGSIVGFLMILDGWPASISMDAAEKIMFDLMNGGELRLPGCDMATFLISVARLLLALALTALAAYCIRRWWQGEAIPLKISFTPKNLSIAKLVPMIFPPILAGYWLCFSVDTAVFPIWVYQKQDLVFLALWLLSAAVTVAVLLLSRRRWTLLPAGVMLLYTLSFPRLCASVRSIGLKTGNLYTEANLNPEHYPPFLQADETVLVLAAVICVGYILFCCIKLWNSPPKAEKPGDDTPM